MFKIISFTISLLFLAFGLVLGIFNPHLVHLDLVLQQTELPLSIIIASSLLAGIFISAIYLGTVLFKIKWNLRVKSKENQRLNNQILDLNRQLIEYQNQADIKDINTPALVNKGS